MLKESTAPLVDSYDVAALDLDGVVYISGHAVAHAPEALTQVQAQGMKLAFITNNAARPPSVVAANLRDLGVPATDADVVNSAQAAAHLLADQLPAGAVVYVIGGLGLEEALRERGLIPVTQPTDDVAAVVQGYGPEMPWKQVLAGAVLVRQGLPWVATNTDMTIPTATGIGPGNGTLVKLVADFAERAPVVAGKPEQPLFSETIDRVGGERPLMIGDRLDTDIEGATAAGWDSLLVLTGVTGLAELVSARPAERPSYLGSDLRSLLTVHPVAHADGAAWELNGWRARVVDAHLVVEGAGDPDDWWRVVATAAWKYLDENGKVADHRDLAPPSVG